MSTISIAGVVLRAELQQALADAAEGRASPLSEAAYRLLMVADWPGAAPEADLPGGAAGWTSGSAPESVTGWAPGWAGLAKTGWAGNGRPDAASTDGSPTDGGWTGAGPGAGGQIAAMIAQLRAPGPAQAEAGAAAWDFGRPDYAAGGAGQPAWSWGGGAATATAAALDMPGWPRAETTESYVLVGTADGLAAALAAAEGGETILLLAGDYGTLKLRDWSVGGEVTLRSLDAGAPARFAGLDLEKVAGLTIENVLFDYTHADHQHATHHRPFEIGWGSADVTIRDSVFDGDVFNGSGRGFGLTIDGSRDILIEGNEMSDFFKGLRLNKTDGAILRDNDIHSIRSDGINVVASSDVLIESNHLHDFATVAGSGDHADMIQVFTQNTDTPTTGLTIRGNILDVGAGGRTQSIWMRNEEVDLGRAGAEMFYRDVVIEDNVIANGHKNGLVVGATDGLVIRNNTLLRVDDPVTDGNIGLSTPRIAVSKLSENVTVTGNVAASVEGALDKAGWTMADNFIVQDQSPDAPGWYHDHMISALSGTDHDLRNLQIRPDSEIAERGLGASALYYDAKPEALTALIRPDAASGKLNAFNFDAGFTADAHGRLDETRGDFLWDFGDGITATGQRGLHVFTEAGSHEVRLTVTGADGASATTQTRIIVLGPDVLDWDAGAGSFVASDETGTSLVAVAGLATSDAPEIGTVVDLGPGLGEMEIGQGPVAKLFGADSFTLSMRLKADAPLDMSAGEIARIHGALNVEIRDTGAVRTQFETREGKFDLWANGDVNLGDGAWHDVTIAYDGQSLRTLVDGTLVNQIAAHGMMKGIGSHGLVLNGDFGARGFDGKLAAFDIDVDAAHYVHWGQDPAAINQVTVGAETVDGVVETREVAAFDPAVDLLVLQAGASVNRIEQVDADTLDIHFAGDGDVLTLGGTGLTADMVQMIETDLQSLG